jgi:uncharacterized protein YdaT
MKKNVHVVPRQDKWAVETDNAERAVKITKTQQEAIEIGKQIAQNNNSELLIHGKDGKIREKNSYGNDTYPPKG